MIQHQFIQPNVQYFKSLDYKSVRIVIVGRDPYPQGAMGIPFCKKTWKELDNRSAGRIILKTYHEININLEPVDSFYAMAQNGIIVVNASYFILGERYTLNKHYIYVKESWDLINKKIFLNLNKSVQILLCGDAKKMLNKEFLIEAGVVAKIKEVSHPCLQSRNKNSKKWDETWTFLHPPLRLCGGQFRGN